MYQIKKGGTLIMGDYASGDFSTLIFLILILLIFSGGVF